jgi:hypothetical protein
MRTGVTGHQEIGTAEEWLRVALISALEIHRVTSGVTSLAAGADQLFAECLRVKNIPFDVIVPCKNYERTFQSARSLSAYNKLLNDAHLITVLDYSEPSEEAFWAAGKAMVTDSNMVFAIWDGEESKGLGGTGDVVKFAVENQIPVVQFDPRIKSIKKIPLKTV